MSLAGCTDKADAKERLAVAVDDLYAAPFEVTIRSVIDGQVGGTYVVRYSPPSSAHLVPVDMPFMAEIIVIGNDAWRREPGGAWVASEATEESVTATALGPMIAASSGELEAEDGIPVDGEATWLLRGNSLDFASNMSAALRETDLPPGVDIEQVIAQYSGARANIEVTLGRESRHILTAALSVTGGTVPANLEWSFQYPDTVVIEAPSSGPVRR
ncbi:MAG: hypothetical protein AB7F65_04340 [Dehalococcoidia bacterium]